MSNYGRGTITLERGKYRVRIANGKGGTTTVGYYDDPDAAEEARATALLARAELTSAPTLREYGERWQARNRKQKNDRTWRNTWCNHVLAAPFADDPVDTIGPPQIDAWLETMPERRALRAVLKRGKFVTEETDRTISEQTARHALGLLNRCFNAAVREGLCRTNPCKGAKMPRGFAPSAKGAADLVEYLDADEVERLLAFEGLPLEQRVVFTVAICQGLREGELAALDWDCVDWDAHELVVAASWDDDTTKTGEARRQTLLPRAEEALRDWQRYRGRDAFGVLFPAHRGRGKAPSGARARRYARGFDWGWSDHKAKTVTRLGWWRRAGVRTQIPFHGLRDTCATHLLSGSWGERWELIDVSRHLGHSSIKVTEERYAHLTKDARRRAALALSTGGKGGNGGGGSARTPAATPPHGSAKTSALPGRFELPTNGLGSISANSDSPQKTASDDAMRQVRGRLALELAELLGRGEAIPDGMIQTFRLVTLARRDVELAMQLEHPGPHRMARLVELVALTLDEMGLSAREADHG
jgi:integrase